MSHWRSNLPRPAMGAPGAATNVAALVRYLFRLCAICVVTALGTAAFAFALVPQVSSLATATKNEAEPINLDPLAQRSLLYDSSGNLIGPLPAVENRSPVTLDQIPALVKRS